jgi:ABC-type sugar transport system permease subunit
VGLDVQRRVWGNQRYYGHDKLGIIDQPIAWLANKRYCPDGHCNAMEVWKTTPFMALLILAGLQIIPSDIYEAADIDGAGKLQQFWTMTLPLLAPALLVAMIFRTMDSLRIFDAIKVMTNGGSGTEVMSTYAHRNMFDFQKIGYGNAISVVIFIIIAVFVIGLPVCPQQNGGGPVTMNKASRKKLLVISCLGMTDPSVAVVLPALPVLLGHCLFVEDAGTALHRATGLLAGKSYAGELSPPSCRDDISYLRRLWNSIVISFVVTFISLMFGSFAAYALGRLPFRGKIFDYSTSSCR